MTLKCQVCGKVYTFPFRLDHPVYCLHGDYIALTKEVKQDGCRMDEGKGTKDIKPPKKD